jgi:hypothetical protein
MTRTLQASDALVVLGEEEASALGGP